jgi:P4 family phage/plasmid primase-like protien
MRFTSDPDEITRAVDLLFERNTVVELRILNAEGGGMVSGNFDGEHRPNMVEAATEWSGKAPAVYFTLNPVDPTLLARSWNRVKKYVKHMAADSDILRRVWLLLDFDPERKSDVSSTDAEHEAAIARARDVRDFLRSLGWPDPILASSGNGAHLLYRIDLPNDQESTTLVKGILESLATRFSDSVVKIDRSVFNPSRVCKLYGTLAAKGDHTPERPHRIARILEVPETIEVVSIDLLRGLLPPVQTSLRPAAKQEDQAFLAVTTIENRSLSDRVAWLEGWLAKYNLLVLDKKPWNGGWIWVLKVCPWNSEHTNLSAYVGVKADGTFFAGCHHNSCSEKGWYDLRDLYEPGWRDEESEFKPRESLKDPHRLARNFLETECHHPDGPVIRFHNGAWYSWDRASYHEVPQKEVRARLTHSIKKEFDRESVEAQKRGDTKAMESAHVLLSGVRNVAGALESLVLIPSTLEAPCWIDEGPVWEPRDLLPAINGVFHIPSLLEGKGDHLEPTPLLFSTFALDYEILVGALAPVLWLQFLNEIWGKDPQSILTFQEFMGYCLTPDTSQQKILSVFGPKRSGKSLLGRVMTGVLGRKNVAGTTLSDLGERFGLHPLMGRNLAIIPDARLRGQNPKVIERMLSISGQDMLLIDRKGYNAIHAVLPTRLMILSNELPRFDDASGALVGRMIVLRTTESFYGREDVHLAERLLKERAGILLWALDGLRRLRERGHFIQPDSGKELVEEWDNLSSPVRTFVKERCDLGPFKQIEVSKLYQEYVEWCHEIGVIHPGAPNTFGRNLRAVVPHLSIIQPRVEEGRVRMYDGIQLLPR